MSDFKLEVERILNASLEIYNAEVNGMLYSRRKVIRETYAEKYSEALTALHEQELIKENKRWLKQTQDWLNKYQEGKDNVSDFYIESQIIQIGVIKERIATLKGKTKGMWKLDKDIWGENTLD